MLKNAVIIIPNISSESQVCDFLWQTKKLLAKNNHVFVTDYFQSINLLPLRRFKVVEELNKAIYFLFLQFYLSIKFYRTGRKYYFWMFFPQLTTAIKFRLPWWQVVFDVVDYHDAPTVAEQKILQSQKRVLLAKADYVFSISSVLKKLYQKDARVEIRVVPQGFDLESFTTNSKKSSIKLPSDKPMIGFVGQISQRLNLKLLLELAANNQQWNFIFVGPKHHESSVASSFHETEIKKLFAYVNVFYFSKQPRREILSIIEQFDVCIIPYDDAYLFNRYCYPMKTFEYFYAGKPVVSTGVIELKKFANFVSIAKTSDDFTRAITDFLTKPLSLKMREQQVVLSKNNTWENKTSEMSRYL